jgi:AcrR family transcriptional regulator
MVQIATERGADRRRDIVSAAARVFRRRGLAATGMREIASELGMAVGNLYYYFRDKEELIAFVQEDALAALLALADRVTALPRPAEEQLYELIVGHVVHLNEGTPGAVAHLEVEALGERVRPFVQERRDAYERRFRELIEAGVASGRLRPLDAATAARLILGALNWTVKWYRPDGSLTAADIGVTAAELLVRGMLAPEVVLNTPRAPRGSLPS